MPLTVITDRDINLSQLSYELDQLAGGGPRGFRYVHGHRIDCLDDELDSSLFIKAVLDHQADPDWQPPNDWPPRPGFLRRLLRRSP